MPFYHFERNVSHTLTFRTPLAFFLDSAVLGRLPILVLSRSEAVPCLGAASS